MLCFYCLVCLLLARYSVCLVCNDILEAPETKKFTLEELKMTPPKEIVECLAHLSKESMPMDEAQYIWKTIVKFYDGVANVPDEKLALLHWVTIAIEPEEYSNITLGQIDVVENFGLDYNLNQHKLTTIADRVREDWGGKEPEDYTHFDLKALRQILCVFNKTEIERIHPQAYKEAAAVLGKLSGCSEEVLQGLAMLAVQPQAFGSPTGWNLAVLDTIGVVVEGLPPDIAKRIRRSL